MYGRKHDYERGDTESVSMERMKGAFVRPEIPAIPPLTNKFTDGSVAALR